MRRAIPLLVAGIYILCIFPLLGLERPQITKVEPSSFIQFSEGLTDSSHVLTITGHYLWPEDTELFPYNKQRVSVLLRSKGGYEKLSSGIRGEISNGLQTLKVTFSGKRWLKEPGSLSVLVIVEEMASNPYPITVIGVPKSPAVIKSVAPRTFEVAYQLPPGTATKEYYRFRVEGRNFDSLQRMALLVDGRRTRIETLEAQKGYLEATIPSALWNFPGKYSIRLYTRKGASRAAYFTIEAEEEEEEKGGQEKQEEQEEVKELNTEQSEKLE